MGASLLCFARNETARINSSVRLSGTKGSGALILAVLVISAFASALEPLHLAVTLHDGSSNGFPPNTYGLQIANRTDHPVNIKQGIVVERQDDSGWKLDRIIQAVSTCEKFDSRFKSDAMVRIDPHGILAVVPRDGWDCKGQCLDACKQNVPPIPGTYRFVVLTSPDGSRIASPTFWIPPLELDVADRTEKHQALTGTAKNYGLTIQNMSKQDVIIMGGITVLKKELTGWSPQLGSVQAVSKCEEFDENYRLEEPVTIPAFHALAVVPWDGFICGGQCPVSCLKNYRLGPGTFRFEVFLLPEHKSIYSPPFTIGAR